MKRIKFASLSYLKEMQRRCNKNKDYLKKAKEETGTYLINLIFSRNRTKIVGFSVKQGNISDVWLGEKPNVDFILSGKYNNWIKVLKGIMDLKEGYIDRYIEIRGNFIYLFRNIKGIEAWLKILRNIPTKF